MAQHGPTLSNSLIYISYEKQREAWDFQLAESEKKLLETPHGQRLKKEQLAAEEEAQRIERENKRRAEALAQALRDGTLTAPTRALVTVVRVRRKKRSA
jgi:hypothetical protein